MGGVATAFDAGPPARAELDASLDAAPALADMPDAGSDAGTFSTELEALQLQRDQLRLEFLRLPEPERVRVLEAVRARRRIAIEEQLSRVAAERATQEALRAEEASDELFSRASVSSSAIESAVLAERARMEIARADFARWEARFARRREAEAQRGAERLTRLHELERQLADELREPNADLLYDEVVVDLIAQRVDLRGLLDEVATESDAPRFELTVDLSERAYRAAEPARELRDAVIELEQSRARAVAEEVRLRWRWLERAAHDLRAFDQIRVELVPRLSQERRDAAQGIGAEARAQLGYELDQIAILGRFWLRKLFHDLPQLPAIAVGIALGPRTRVDAALAFLVFVMRV